MVFAPDGRTWNLLSGRSSSDDSSGRTSPTETDQRDAELLLKLLVENRFPSIWQPSQELLDLRGLLLHRHQWVRMRTRIQNALQAIALANGLRRGSSLWSESGQRAIASLPLATHTAHRRSELQAMCARFEAEIEQLNQQVLEQAGQRPTAGLLMTHPGVGPITGFGCGSYCEIRLITKSSVVVDRFSREAVMPVRKCLERVMVPRVTV
jgi:hypothetical protein